MGNKKLDIERRGHYIMPNQVSANFWRYFEHYIQKAIPPYQSEHKIEHATSSAKDDKI